MNGTYPVHLGEESDWSRLVPNRKMVLRVTGSIIPWGTKVRTDTVYRACGIREDTAAHPSYISYGGGYCSGGAGEAKRDPSLCLMMKELAFQ